MNKNVLLAVLLLALSDSRVQTYSFLIGETALCMRRVWERTNSGSINLNSVPLFMLDLARAGSKQAFLIWLDEYEMQTPGRATEQG